MKPHHLRLALSTVWSCSAVAAGAIGLARTPGQWIAVGFAAVVPPVLVLYFSREPLSTTAQDIREALR